MEIYFTLEHQSSYYLPVVTNLGKYLIWRSAPQFRSQGWDRLCFLPSGQLASRCSDKAYPILVGNVSKGTEHVRPCFLMI